MLNIFHNCRRLNNVYCYADIVPNTSYNAFSNTLEFSILHVPELSIESYKAIEPWKTFKEIVALTDSDPKPTGINMIEASNNEKGVIYDFHGRRVEQPTKGLYIKNGKKYVVR